MPWVKSKAPIGSVTNNEGFKMRDSNEQLKWGTRTRDLNGRLKLQTWTRELKWVVCSVNAIKFWNQNIYDSVSGSGFQTKTNSLVQNCTRAKNSAETDMVMQYRVHHNMSVLSPHAKVMRYWWEISSFFFSATYSMHQLQILNVVSPLLLLELYIVLVILVA